MADLNSTLVRGNLRVTEDANVSGSISEGGTLLSDKYQAKLSSQTAYSAKGSATKVPQITTNTLGQVTGITEVTITQPTVNNGKLSIQGNGTTASEFTANQSGDTTLNIKGSGGTTVTKSAANEITISSTNVPASLDDVPDGNTRKLANYLPLAGGTLKGNLVLENNLSSPSGASPSLIFKRGTYVDSYNDWKIVDESGYLVFYQSGSSSPETWTERFKIQSGELIENGTSLANKYLGKTAKAADADKLDGNDSSYFLNTSATAQTKTGNLTLSGTTDVSGGTLKLKTVNAPTTSGGSTFGPGSNGQVLKSNGTTVYWATDSMATDTWRNVKVDGTEKLGTATSTDALDFLSQNTNNGDVSFTYDATNKGIKATAKIPTALKNPNSIKIQGGGADVASYDGSAAKTFNWKASTTAGAFEITDGTTTKTVQLAGVFTDNNQTVKGNGTAFGANDAVDIVAGSNITVTADTTNKKITIAGTANDNQKVKTSSVTFGANDVVEIKAGSNVTVTGDSSAKTITIAASQPTVNNGTLTIQKNGTNVATFTANQSGNSTANITVPVNLADLSNRKQALIEWGGPDLVGNASPLDVAIIDDLGHNKFAFMSAASVVIQYSRDGGSTWTDYGSTDNEKRSLVTLSGNFSIGKRTGSNNTVNDKLRVILNSNNAGGNVYTSLRRLLFYVSTNGSGGSNVKIETRTIGNYRNNVDTWDDNGTHNLSGWSGWNSPEFACTFGGSNDQTSQIAQIRLTFGVTSVSTTYGNFQLLAIRAIGFPLWGSPSTMASTGHLYSFDIAQNATFPNNVYAVNFYENGTALSSKYVAKSDYSYYETDNVNLNTVTGNGFHRLGTGTVNGPANEDVSYGQMFVSTGGTSSPADSTAQILVDYNSQNMFFRGGSTGSGGTWQNWAKVIHSGNIGSQNVDKVDGKDAADFVYYLSAPTSMPGGGGAAITNPSGSNAFSIRTRSTSGDMGIFYMSDDNTYIANANDNSYNFAIFDTDYTTDFSDDSKAELAVLGGSAGVTIRGNTVIHTGNISQYASKVEIVDLR